MNENQERPRGLGGIGEGLRTGVGVLNAFREAIEETIAETMEGSGEVTPERARALMREAAGRMQSSLEETRERFDFVSRREMDELRREVSELRQRVAALEGTPDLETQPTLASPDDAEDHEGIIIVPD